MKSLDLQRLEKLGMIFPEASDILTPAKMREVAYAMDAQPTLTTSPNSAVPSFMTQYVDPRLTKILFSPMKAAVILDEVKKGDWLMLQAAFPVVESTGETASYGDFNESGQANANFNFPQRQSYHYQTITQWGERELEMVGLAKIDWVNELNIASALALNKFQNKAYFFGIANLQNYGLLNDPNLQAAISPTGAWSTGTSELIYEDIRRIFTQLQTQADGTVEYDSEMVLGLHPIVETYLLKTNDYNVNVVDQLKKNFPNMRIVSAVEYNITGTGQLVQMIARTVEGQKTAECAFTEKMRAHRIVPGLSSFRQKKSQGVWGTVLYQPFAIASMSPIV